MTRDGQSHRGVVVANYGQTLLVEDAQGGLHPCVARKKVGVVVSGDRVSWQPGTGGHGAVTEVAARSSLLARPDRRGQPRPICANIDRLIIVAAVPVRGTIPNAALIDSYTVAAETLGVTPVILINKIDLAVGAELAAIDSMAAEYRDIGYRTLYSSAKDGQGLDRLRELLRDHAGVFVGESGVGKSSLIQRLLPDQELRIGALSAAGGLGRHTTTTTMLFHLPEGGDVIDSPGVRDFAPGAIAPADLAWAFREFRELLGACRYRDCRHDGEPGCAVAEAAAAGRLSERRLRSYRMLLKNSM